MTSLVRWAPRRMRDHRLPAIGLLIAFMSMTTPLAASPRLDHVSVCATDLDILQKGFADAGLIADADGLHANASSRMAHIGFDDKTYIELIGPAVPGTFEGSPWSALMAGNAGPCFWFALVDDVAGEVKRLKEAGVEATAPRPGGRASKDGKAVEWISSMAGTGSPGAVLPLMIEDKTARDLRVRTSASVKGAPVSGVDTIVIGVKDLDGSIALFRKAYDWPAPAIQHDKAFGTIARFEGEPVILASASSGWVADRVAKFGDGPVALLLGASDFKAARAKYSLSGKGIWFGKRVGWFDAARMGGVRLGVIAH